MSQLTALPRPATRAVRPSRPARGVAAAPRLRVVETKDAAEHTGVGFVVLCVLLLVGGLLSLLLLNTNRAQESFAIDKLQTTSAGLTDQQQQLSSEIDAMSAPQQLALRAQQLGLGPATELRYVRKADGKLIGVAKRPAADSAFTVGTLPSTPASKAAGEAINAASSGLLVTKPKAPSAAPTGKSTTSAKDAKGSPKTSTSTTTNHSKPSGKHDGTSKSTKGTNSGGTAGSTPKSTKPTN